MPTIICAFQGTGKTHTASRSINSVDLDCEKYKGPNFAKNYVDAIEKYYSDPSVEYIFVSCHKKARDELLKRNMEFIMVYPSILLKEEYLQRYTDSGMSEERVSKMRDNWTSYIVECAEQIVVRRYVLRSGKNLSDVLDAIEANKTTI